MTALLDRVHQLATEARKGLPALARTSSAERDRLLRGIVHQLKIHADEIWSANLKDLARAEAEGLAKPLIDRLNLGAGRLKALAEGVEQVAALIDPLGQVVAGWTRPNGLSIEQVRVPLGLVGFIYEARPNVTIEAASLCLKAGNGILLRGGSAALETNRVLVRALQAALVGQGLPASLVSFVDDPSRESVEAMLGLTGLLDVVIPRGGEGLIRTVVEKARVPVIETGVGNCHVYVDASADPDMATAIVLNAKTQRPSVCNAAETLLVHRDLLETWLPGALEALELKGCEIRGDADTCRVFARAVPASETDWDTEFLDLVLAVRVVASLDDALDHIRVHGSRHSEAIVTRDLESSERFLHEVDAAVVYVNASTRFTDGGEFGFGAEVGISTQKLHARGPMGLKELTTTQYRVRGKGQVRG
jgi:glutamate-5-semialdehyde dehydrogenase